jgi:hypothetical protein
MNEIKPLEEVSHRQKKIKSDESNIRQQCRFTCGADVVIGHVLPYLIITVAEESDSYAESDSNTLSVDESNEESDSNVSSDDESSSM